VRVRGGASHRRTNPAGKTAGSSGTFGEAEEGGDAVRLCASRFHRGETSKHFSSLNCGASQGRNRVGRGTYDEP